MAMATPLCSFRVAFVLSMLRAHTFCRRSGIFTFEALNLHREKSTLEKIVPQGLIRNTGSHSVHWRCQCIAAEILAIVLRAPRRSAFFLDTLRTQGLYISYTELVRNVKGANRRCNKVRGCH